MVKKIIIDDMIWELVKMDAFLKLYELIDNLLKLSTKNQRKTMKYCSIDFMLSKCGFRD